MQQIEVTDLSFDTEMKSARYDCYIVGVGFESRTEHILDRLRKADVMASHALVLVFPDVNGSERVGKICAIIESISPQVDVKTVGTNSQSEIWKLLRERFQAPGSVRILIDYSSMSRAWYAAMLSWFWENSRLHLSCQLDFLYALGKYSKDFAEKEVVIDDIEIVPGCAGEMFRHSRTVAVFGLGFYGYMSLCACEQIEPDVLYTFSTTENPIEGFCIEESAGNRELVQRASKSFKLSVTSVASAYRCLSEISAIHLNKGDEVILAPMGPKPHVLAAVLVSLANRRVCTLRVRHEQYKSDVEASGPIIATRIKFVTVEKSLGADPAKPL